MGSLPREDSDAWTPSPDPDLTDLGVAWALASLKAAQVLHQGRDPLVLRSVCLFSWWADGR